MTAGIQPTPAPYPVRVDATLDGRLSRWLWLVKWLLVIPHYIVLALLWIAFLVFSVVAFFAIVFTGRYPRALFDFNVGVLRWTWRVSYYTYGALGTDRYPPFTLGEVPDYPAQLHIAYPDHLSRGLVWVKWWLLAIPHYLVIAFFVGGGAWLVSESASDAAGGPGLITLLVLIAAVVLLFRGRYPRSIFDLVLGMNRWVLRVAAYGALMTDRYPPFRLDLGGDDPGTLHASTPAPPAPAGPAAATSPLAAESGPRSTAAAPAPRAAARQPASRTVGHQPAPWSAGRVLAVVLGMLMVLMSLGLLAGSATALVADQVLRDDDGYLTSPREELATTSAALLSDPVDLHAAGGPEAFYAERLLGDVRVRVTPSDPEAEVFVGLARTAAVESFLEGVPYDIVTDVSEGDPTYVAHAGSQPAAPPAQQDFWLASSQGVGTQTMDWPLEDGEWTLVVMNADGRPGLDVEGDIGATVPGLDTLFWVLLGSGVALFAGGILIVYAAASRAERRTAAAGAPPPPPA